MRKNPRTPEELAEELLGRKLEELDPEDRRVLARLAAGTLVGPDADELAAMHATRGDHIADRVAAIGGSWGFIIGFAVVLFSWMLLNSGLLQALGFKAFDAYPYIFLNLMLSMLAAVQAPIIMMSQNRQAAKDRLGASLDYEVNLRAELEIMRIHEKLDDLIMARLDELAAGQEALFAHLGVTRPDR